MSQCSIEIYEDAGFSGKNTNRPALQEMLQRVRAGGVDAVVVWKLDRLSRSLRDTLTLIEDLFQPLHVRLVSVTESIDTSSPAGRMMLNMLASFAQLEREQDSDRVVMAHKHLAHDCRYLGGHVPLGYAIDETGHYELDLATAPIVRQVFEMYLSRCGYSEILAFLNSHISSFGHRKTPFGKTDLKYLLHNEVYSGTYIRKIGQDKRSKVTSPEIIRVPGGIPAIISQEEWRKVMAIRDENKTNRSAAMYRTRRVYPLTGLVYCAVCNRLMPLNHGGKDRAGNVERYYTCRDKHVQPLRLEKAEQAVFDSVDALLADLPSLRKSCAIANEFVAASNEDRQQETLALRARQQELSRQSAKLLEFVKASGSTAPLSILDELNRLDREQKEIQIKFSASRPSAAAYDVEQTISSLRAVQQARKWPPEKQKPVIQAAIQRVVVSTHDIRVYPTWHTCADASSPLHVCHVIERHR